MTNKWLNISLEDLDGDKSPEVLIEYYDEGDEDTKGKKPKFAVSVKSSKKNGVYDSIEGGADADGDGDYGDADDVKAYTALANAFVKIAL